MNRPDDQYDPVPWENYADYLESRIQDLENELQARELVEQVYRRAIEALCEDWPGVVK